MGKARLYALRLTEIAPTILALAKAVSRARPDVVHVQTEVVPGVDPLILRRISRRRPVVLTVHDPMPLEGGARAAADQARRWRAADALIIHGEEPRCFRRGQRSRCARPRRACRPCPRGTGHPPRRGEEEARARRGPHRAPPRPGPAVQGHRAVGPGMASGGCRRAEGSASRRGGGLRFGRSGPPGRLSRGAGAAGVRARGRSRPVGGGGRPPRPPVCGGVAFRECCTEDWGPGHRSWRHRPWPKRCTGPERRQIVPLDPVAWAEALVPALSDRPLPRPSPPTGRGTARGTLAVYQDVLATHARRAWHEISHARRDQAMSDQSSPAPPAVTTGRCRIGRNYPV